MTLLILPDLYRRLSRVVDAQKVYKVLVVDLYERPLDVEAPRVSSLVSKLSTPSKDV